MKKVYLICLFVIINLIFAVLLIDKQNKITALLYDLQKLQESKDLLTQKVKNLNFLLQKEKQLSGIQSFAKEKLHMKPISIQEAKTLTTATVS